MLLNSQSNKTDVILVLINNSFSIVYSFNSTNLQVIGAS